MASAELRLCCHQQIVQPTSGQLITAKADGVVAADSKFAQHANGRHRLPKEEVVLTPMPVGIQMHKRAAATRALRGSHGEVDPLDAGA